MINFKQITALRRCIICEALLAVQHPHVPCFSYVVLNRRNSGYTALLTLNWMTSVIYLQNIFGADVRPISHQCTTRTGARC